MRATSARSRAHAALSIATFAGVSAAAGCLLTSDFDGVAGVRPATEAGEAGDADIAETAPPSPCLAGGHLVCNDFDHAGGGFPVPGWNQAFTDAGTLTLDNTDSITPPLSLHAKVEGTVSAQAYLYRQLFVGTFKALVIAFDIRIVSCPAQGKSLTLVYVEPSAKASFGLVMLSSGVLAIGSSINGASTFFALEQQIKDDTWSHVVYRIVLKDVSTAHFNLTIDGKTSVDTDGPSAAMGQTALLNLGIIGSQGAPKGCEIVFDNYVLDKE